MIGACYVGASLSFGLLDITIKSLVLLDITIKKLEKSCCEEVVSDTMDLLRLPLATEGQQIIVVGQRKIGGGGGCAQFSVIRKVVYR